MSALPAQSPCRHCGAAVEADAPKGAVYCCSGCELAAAIVDGAGLEAYYAGRSKPAPRPEGPARGLDQLHVETDAAGLCHATLRLDGLRCASCVWLTERVIEGRPGVKAVQVSYATGRTRLSFDGAVTDLTQILSPVAALGYRPQALSSAPVADRDLLIRLGVAIFAATNVMMLSVSVYLGWWQGMEERFATLFRWATLALATPATLWSATPFFRAAWVGVRHKSLSMDLPVSIGVALLYGHGLLATFAGQDGYLDSLTMLIALLLAGRVLEQRGRQGALAAAQALAATAPRVARRIEGDRIVDIDPKDLDVGDLIEVAAGEELPADAVVVSGTASVAMALLTGESEPVAVLPESAVVAGALVQEGALRCRVTAVGGETLLQRLARGLAEATDRPVEPGPIDRIAPLFTAGTLLAAAGTFVGWWLQGGLAAAIPPTVAVLVVACPCALALAQPLAVAAGLGASARRGLLFRSGDALRALAQIDTVALDKTGTATGGRPVVVLADDATLRIAAGIERSSIHPIARAIVEEASRRGLPIPMGRLLQEVPGVGITGEVDGTVYTIARGGPGTVEVRGVGTITLRDTLRQDAAATIADLRAAGARVVLLTGDHGDVARRVAWSAGIDHVVADQRPDDKARWIAAARAEGHRVLFVGDGLNDGPALRAADVGLAMGSGAPSTMMAADAVVAGEGLGPILSGLRAARAAERAIRGNLRRSVIYNILAVCAAAAGLINPLVAAVLMPLSSGLVIWGALGVERALSEKR